MKTTIRKDSEFLGDLVDLIIKAIESVFSIVAEFIAHPKEKPKPRKKK